MEVFRHLTRAMSSPSRSDLLQAIASADADRALASSTKSKYRSAVVSFLWFCKEENYPQITSVASLSAFISYSCRRISQRTRKPVSPCTVEAYLLGLASAFRPILLNILDFTNHTHVRKVLKGCKKQFSLPVNRKEPLSLADLVLVSPSANTSFDSCSFYTLLTLGSHSLHRLGELTVPDNPHLKDSRKIISRLSVVVSDCGSFIRYTLPYHKANPFFLGSTIIVSTSQVRGACPITTLLNYLALRDDLFISSLFLFLTSSGSPPSRSWFLRRFHHFFDKSKSGHSMRSGGASALAQAGLPHKHIQDMGRWSSEAFKTYIRDHPIMRLPLQRRFPMSMDGHLGAGISFGDGRR